MTNSEPPQTMGGTKTIKQQQQNNFPKNWQKPKLPMRLKCILLVPSLRPKLLIKLESGSG